mgnify:CR=1 FL=1
MKNTEKNKIKWVEKVKYTLELGGKSDKTFDNYKSHIVRFLNYYTEDVDIDKLSEDEIVEYFRKQYINLNRCATTLNVGIFSIKFLYSVCFNRKINKDVLPSTKLKKKLPTIISKQLFLKIFNEEHCLQYKCWLILAFCSGLRVQEIAKIRIEDIYPNEHKIKVLGKGNKERYTILPDITIKLLRMYCKEKHITNKQGYLFTSTINKEKCINSKSIINYFSTLKVAYNLDKNISFHTLRHSFATYYLINGGNIIALKTMLGHSHLNTTNIYLHISQNFNQLEGIKYV